ncbi:MAG TPA: hypothetical protein PKW95_15065 [bacterium]|nr:hypothetical protein [bacterium]
MGRETWRNKVVESSLLDRIDRGRSEGKKPQGGEFEETVKKRLHECSPGDYVREVLKGANNLGPLLRVIDPKAGILESRAGQISRMSPRTQVAVQV